MTRPNSHTPGDQDKRVLIVEIEREVDGRWLAEIPSAPGVMAYGATRADAAMNALILLDTADMTQNRCLTCGIIGRHLCAYGQ
jgi:hypothetical protein